jgi:tRNA A37 threonylcarbamoyladenosine biosynthesis protein TsaE
MKTRKVVVRFWNKKYNEVESVKEFTNKKKAIAYADLYKLEDDEVTTFEIKNYNGTKDVFLDVK